MANVSIQHLSSVFAAEKGRETAAVRDFSLEVNDKEFVVLAGPSGAGKSAILRAIAGLDAVSQGEILIADKRVNGLPPVGRDVAMVFQNSALYPHMSVFDNIAFGLNARKAPKAEIKKRVTEAAGILGIESLLERMPKTLSAADSQRVAIGRAIVRQPKVFLFDEPLGGLDPKMRLQMRTEIIKLQLSLQATIIYATRDQAEAMTMGSRAAVLHDGVIQQTGAPLASYRQPANLFVAGFLGNPPMNFIRGKLRETAGALVFREEQDGVIEVKMPSRPEAQPYVGREIIAGVRPEDIRFVPGADRAPGLRFQSLVDIVEHSGAEANIHFQTGAHALICRTNAEAGADDAGHRGQFEIDPARVHLFDPESGLRLAAAV